MLRNIHTFTYIFMNIFIHSRRAWSLVSYLHTHKYIFIYAYGVKGQAPKKKELTHSGYKLSFKLYCIEKEASTLSLLNERRIHSHCKKGLTAALCSSCSSFHSLYFFSPTGYLILLSFSLFICSSP